MNKKSSPTIFLIFIGIFIALVIGQNFRRYHIIKNYSLNVFTSCDVEKHNCFQVASGTVDLLPFQVGQYAKVEIIATYAPVCLDEHTCSDFSCDGIIDSACRITYCSEDTKEEGEICSNESQ